MGIEGPGGKGPKVPGSGATGIDGPGAIRGADRKQADFGKAVEGADKPAPTGQAEPPAGMDEVRRIAGALRSGEIATRDEAITRAAGAMLKARLTKIPQAALERAAAEVARLALEDPSLRSRVSRLLDRLAAEDG